MVGPDTFELVIVVAAGVVAVVQRLSRFFQIGVLDLITGYRWCCTVSGSIAVCRIIIIRLWIRICH